MHSATTSRAQASLCPHWVAISHVLRISSKPMPAGTWRTNLRSLIRWQTQTIMTLAGWLNNVIHKCIVNENLSHLGLVSHLLPSLVGAADKKTVTAASNAKDYRSAHMRRSLWWQPMGQPAANPPWRQACAYASGWPVCGCQARVQTIRPIGPHRHLCAALKDGTFTGLIGTHQKLVF